MIKYITTYNDSWIAKRLFPFNSRFKRRVKNEGVRQTLFFWGGEGGGLAYKKLQYIVRFSYY